MKILIAGFVSLVLIAPSSGGWLLRSSNQENTTANEPARTAVNRRCPRSHSAIPA
jgi:hypothetical protein